MLDSGWHDGGLAERYGMILFFCFFLISKIFLVLNIAVLTTLVTQLLTAAALPPPPPHTHTQTHTVRQGDDWYGQQTS